MTTCIYGTLTYEEGAVIGVNGRGLRCVAGEWVETGQPFGEEGADPISPAMNPPGATGPEPGDDEATKAKR